MADILIVRNRFDTATMWTNWIGEGLKVYLESKGYSVTDLNDAQASPENVNHWLNYNDKRTGKLAILFDHGSLDVFWGEVNNQAAGVITKTNAENLTKELHVYTFACSTNGDNGLGQTAVDKGCYSWLGYTEPVYVITQKYAPLKECIWSYIESIIAGKTIEQCEADLRQAYKDRFSNHWIFKYNHDRLLLRKKQSGMSINSHYRLAGWNLNKTVLRTHAKNGSKMTWAIINGISGWLKVSPATADGVTNVFMVLCEALANNRKVDVYIINGQITQVTLR